MNRRDFLKAGSLFLACTIGFSGKALAVHCEETSINKSRFLFLYDMIIDHERKLILGATPENVEFLENAVKNRYILPADATADQCKLIKELLLR
ncbi:MAG: hypothetical protein HQM10_13705 [Candidatus Riflebacteria bacterium]|nr:hypothetical protein [Candidatus Riflebacteria bacterium]